MRAIVARNDRPHIERRSEEANAKRTQPVAKLAVGRWNEPIP
jgi:hypothetical protein